ncbi:hypothetical protein LSH36_231g02015 [Paralvinella palmiformis]|uniref:Uncharacterized protein n=1 Tax=Paralvinella palmiformis TaxID=53620 RepID=A0AAD9JNN4_9ANNE|nr:hypothetical protein LSH36_231g02015 [Paralvinella palmiformis]
MPMLGRPRLAHAHVLAQPIPTRCLNAAPIPPPVPPPSLHRDRVQQVGFQSSDSAALLCAKFCVGDRFYLCDNKILCEYDYEERMLFASMPYNYNALSQIKRQAQILNDDMSSGYGSPSPSSL